MPNSATVGLADEDLSYPVTYQRELSPTWLHHVVTLAGFRARNPRAPFRYLELGCGRGNSALVHARSHPLAEFLAVDCEADAIDATRRAAEEADVRNLQFECATFEALLSRNTGTFDVIALHGVYSWVDPAVRATVRALLRDRLADRGIAYVSYNCFPGWASELPLRRLFLELDGIGMHRRMNAARQTIAGFSESNFAFFTEHLSAKRAVESWRGQPLGYLKHEYLSGACEPMWSVDVIDEMYSAGLIHAGSAVFRDHHRQLLINAEIATAIDRLKTPRRRCLALDFALNRAFRRDVFVRNGERLTENERCAALKRLTIESTGEPAQIPDAIKVPRGRIRFRSEFISELRRTMAGGPLALGEIARSMGGSAQPEMLRNLLWLIAGDVLKPAGVR